MLRNTYTTILPLIILLALTLASHYAYGGGSEDSMYTVEYTVTIDLEDASGETMRGSLVVEYTLQPGSITGFHAVSTRVKEVNIGEGSSYTRDELEYFIAYRLVNSIIPLWMPRDKLPENGVYHSSDENLNMEIRYDSETGMLIRVTATPTANSSLHGPGLKVELTGTNIEALQKYISSVKPATPKNRGLHPSIPPDIAAPALLGAATAAAIAVARRR